MPDVVFGVRFPLTEPSLHLETSSLVSLPVFTLDLLSVVVVKTQRLSSDLHWFIYRGECHRQIPSEGDQWEPCSTRKTIAQAVGWSASDLKLTGLIRACSHQKWWFCSQGFSPYVSGNGIWIIASRCVALIKFTSRARWLWAQAIVAISMPPWTKDSFWPQNKPHGIFLLLLCDLGYVQIGTSNSI